MEGKNLDLLSKAVITEALSSRAERESLTRAPELSQGGSACLSFSEARALARGRAASDAELYHLENCRTCARRVGRFRSLAEEQDSPRLFLEAVEAVAAAARVPVELIREWIQVAKRNASILLGPLASEAACASLNEAPQRVEAFLWKDLEIIVEPRSDLDRLFLTVLTRSQERDGTSVGITLVGEYGDRRTVGVRLAKGHPDDQFVIGTAVLDEPYERTITRLGTVIVPVPAEDEESDR